MYLIAIEGIDGVGKHTQASMLNKYYQKKGFESNLVSFPVYKQFPTGKIIKKYLNGEFGDPNTIDRDFISSIYTLNRINFFNETKDNYTNLEYYDSRDVLIADRYRMSNVICQLHKSKGNKKKWIQSLMDAESGLVPRENLTIILDLPLKTSIRLIAERKEESNYILNMRQKNLALANNKNKYTYDEDKPAESPKDFHETIEMQTQFKENLDWIIKNKTWFENNWALGGDRYDIEVIDCSDGEFILPKKEIAAKIRSAVYKHHPI